MRPGLQFPVAEAVQTPAPPGAAFLPLGLAALRVEGEVYAKALVLNLRAGKAAPGAIAALLRVLPDGPLLAGACAVLACALREGSRHG